MNTAKDEALIRSTIQDWTRAIGNKDAEAVSHFFTKDVVTFDLAPPLKHTGFDRKMLEQWFKTWNGRIGYEPTDLGITVGGDLAVARSIDHMTGTKTDGEKVDLWTRSTVCFRKTGDAWKVMHVHSSVPFYMDGSLKAPLISNREATFRACPALASMAGHPELISHRSVSRRLESNAEPFGAARHALETRHEYDSADRIDSDSDRCAAHLAA